MLSKGTLGGKTQRKAVLGAYGRCVPKGKLFPSLFLNDSGGTLNSQRVIYCTC